MPSMRLTADAPPLSRFIRTLLASGTTRPIADAVLSGFRVPIRAESIGVNSPPPAVKSLALAAAREANPRRSGLRALLQVVRRQFMTAFAVRLTGVEVFRVPNRILRVLTAGAPCQIAQSIVARIVIKMPRLHPFWPLPPESLQHKTMNGSIHSAREDDMKVIASAQLARFQSSTRAPLFIGLASSGHCGDDLVQRTDITLVADFVPAFEAGHRCPLHRHDDIPTGVA